RRTQQGKGRKEAAAARRTAIRNEDTFDSAHIARFSFHAHCCCDDIGYAGDAACKAAISLRSRSAAF
ncbi:unnamed protein product, partial [Laminaria digitata]